ncbi:hypothetical protein [Lysinibacillus endophyticus]|uniref:hypothetical protein n=1 Tax=Ureibacillus endophyticus TaxID=1978490 RepID=UPI00209DB42E|nr:hypothetical protein [Lysinibacillus endophyticus]MCP1143775.1 hypothetical protein [Lysinibacillus endophyticus]
MAYIPIETVPYFEAAIYLPMLLIVLEKDYTEIENGQFKFKSPYIYLIEEARRNVEIDLKNTKAYLRKHQLKVVRKSRDDLFSEYEFHYAGTLEIRRYANIRLRNHVEELLKLYLKKALISYSNG